jgi:hypothetical protein
MGCAAVRLEWRQVATPMRRRALITTLAVTVIIVAANAVTAAWAEFTDTLAPPMRHPAIEYNASPAHDPVGELNRKLQAGTAHLKFEEPAGYLRSVLEALNIPIESQIAVFSKTSLQLERISPSNPRTLFFNDSVVVGWMGGGMVELAAHDPRQGVKFYTLQQRPVNRPNFEPGNECLRCHVSDAGLGVPGMMARSLYTSPDGSTRLVYGGSFTDHRSPLEERFGGWYVTGSTGGARHLGNLMITEMDTPEGLARAKVIQLDSLQGKFNTSGYLSPYSDIAALMVFDHQMHMMNLITRVGWEARAAWYQTRPPTLLRREPLPEARDIVAVLRDAAAEFVDYLLFVDEAPLAGKIRGNSGFTEVFAARGPAQGTTDRRGRSFRQLDLETRLLRYPCSYMIYSEAFDALPGEAKAAIYARMWQVLSGSETGKKYARLTLSNRRAVVEILRDTKKDLPQYFTTVVR